MFTHVTDASKIAIAHLARFLEQQGFRLIDCQMNTSHLASLGAREIARADFVQHLAHVTPEQAPRWQFLPVYWNALLRMPAPE